MNLNIHLIHGWFKVSAKSDSLQHWCVSMLFSVSSVSWRNTHQVSAKSVYYCLAFV